MVIVQVKVTYHCPEFPQLFYLRSNGELRTAFLPTPEPDVLLCRLPMGRDAFDRGECTENSLVDRGFQFEVSALHKKTTIRSN
jgi:hypothetical protein